MIKPASGNCNMRCDYCFYHDVSDRRKDGIFGVMDFATSKSLIDKTFKYAGKSSVAFAFQGGEPCLAGLDFFRNFTEYAKSANKQDCPLFYSFQTNGALLNDAWGDFLKKENFLVGISLDGDFKANNHRQTVDGKPAYFDIMKGVGILEKYAVPFNILNVLTGECADNILNIYDFFKNQGFKYLQFTPCIPPFYNDKESPLYMTSKQYEKFLIMLFQAYVKDYVRGNYISVRSFDNMARLYLNQPAEQCGMNGHCAFQYAVEANGNVYPCDFYCLDEWLLGNINHTDFYALHQHPKAIKFIKDSLILPERCNLCKHLKMCRGGGCKRLKESADYCAAYKAFFDACLPLFRVFRFHG
jgi:uncharacterized protein